MASISQFFKLPAKLILEVCQFFLVFQWKGYLRDPTLTFTVFTTHWVVYEHLTMAQFSCFLLCVFYCLKTLLHTLAI